MNQEFLLALDHLADEKKMDKGAILEAVEAALAAAYRKDYGKPSQMYRCQIDPENGAMQFWQVKKVVEEITDEEHEILLKDAKKIDKTVELEGEVTFPVPTQDDFGRIAAQTAKQVIIQKLKEMERDIIFDEFKNQEGKIINGVFQQLEGANMVVDLGRANGVLFPSEQIPGEHYRVGQRIKVYVVSVEKNNRGPQIIVSRSHANIIRELFAIEVPEIEAGTVQIMGIAREAGVRTKMAVRALQDGVDPVGSCVGQRGTRVQAVLSEIGNEKIDIILWDEDVETYIINALSPAKVSEIRLDEKRREAVVYVENDQLSLAIGKNGQNVRLAAKLTDWKIDVFDVVAKVDMKPVKKEKEETAEAEEKPKKKAPKKSKKTEETTEEAPEIIEVSDQSIEEQVLDQAAEEL
ncbi:MAG: transcription termination factor NusA [Patescibacteria group bacterium]